MKKWIWILIALIVIALGVGAYLWLTKGTAGIPQPPALPA